MNAPYLRLLPLGWLLVVNGSLFAATLSLDFEELPLESADYYNGSDLADGFASYGVSFNNLYTPILEDCCWNGWAYSKTNNNTSPGPANQYSAFAGSGADDSLQYGVAFSGFDAGGGIIPEIALPLGAEPINLQVTNTTYAALSMQVGDGFAKKFGGILGTDPDWFLLTIQGLDVDDKVVGDVPFYLADYRFADSAADYILDTWNEIDLAPLAGIGVRKLAFRLSSSDVGPFGMNTPAYVAVDNLRLDVIVAPGDFDLNGIVDGVDRGIWEKHFGTGAEAAVTQGDANDDGDVDGNDFLIWQRNTAAPQPTPLSVPEPTASALIGVVVGVWSGRNLRRLGRVAAVSHSVVSKSVVSDSCEEVSLSATPCL